MTPQELKNSILQLAIQGKLVEQRAEEGTGRELLEKILVAKMQRTQRRGKGRLTRSRGERGAAPTSAPSASPRDEIPDDEKPFDIPDSWEWVRLGAIGSWSAGATPLRTQPDYYGGNIPWLKTGDLNDGYVTEIPETITEVALEKTSVRLNPVGSVLMAMYGATIGKLGILKIPATTNQACCACIPCKWIYNEYLFYFLRANRSAFIKMGEGGAQPNISKEKIVKTLFPLPPLAEQKRIVAKIEELLPLIDRYEKAWSRLESFNKSFPVDMQKSILQMAIQGKLVEQRAEEGTGRELLEKILAAKNAKDVEKGKGKGRLTRRRGERGAAPTSAPSPLLGHPLRGQPSAGGYSSPRDEIPDDEKPFEIPDSWEWVRLEDLVIKDIKRGKSPTYTQKSGTLVFAQKCNTKAGVINLSLALFLDEAKLSKYPESEFMRDCDIVINSTGNGTLGRVGIYRDSDNPNKLPVVPDSHVTVIRVGEKVSVEYVFYGLKHYQPLLEKLCSGSTNQTELSASTVKSLLFPLPPLAEQKRIVAKLEELLPLCERLK